MPAANKPTSAPITRKGAPTHHSMPSIRAAKMMAVPRSFCSTTNPINPQANTTKGTTTCLAWFSRARLVSSTAAPHTTSASLANSAGWMRSIDALPPPRLIQFLLPPTP